MFQDRGLTDDGAILMMAVAALLLAITLAGAVGDGGGGPEPVPEASFVFDRNGTDVVVTHFGGDAVDGERLYVVSRDRGPLGNVAGTNGQACEASVPEMTPGSSCRVPEAAYDRLLVVWRRSANDSHILARRGASPTPTPTPTATPTPTPTPAATATPTARPEQPRETTATPPATATATPTPPRRNRTTVNGTES